MTSSTQFLTETKTAVLIRKIEEGLLDLFKKGRINGTVHTCVGQEFVGVFVSKYLQEHDFVISNHRGHGHYISRTGDVRGLILEVMGKVEGCAKGVGGSQHLVNHNYLSNGIQGGMSPIAAGIAFAQKALHPNSITVCYIGDGTLGEGVLYEAFNLAAMMESPVLFVLENNRYAQSTSFLQTFRGSTQQRAEGFGLTYFKSDIYDLGHLDSTCQLATDFCRTQNKPALLEISCYRLNSHSKGDDNRKPEEISRHAEKDPLNYFQKSHPEAYAEFEAQANQIIDQVIAESDTIETLTDLPRKSNVRNHPTNFLPVDRLKGKRFNDELYDAFARLFESNDRLQMMGEDIEHQTDQTPVAYGGAFKVTKDLSTLFPNRVWNTPISEAGIVGFSCGMAVAGLRPIAEIMFGDFSTLILDQLLQHASKFKAMYAGKITAPVIVRTPMGGHRGYGPTHSQSIEKLFLGIPDLNVVALNHWVHPFHIYHAVLQLDTPTIVIENKVVYSSYFKGTDLPNFDVTQSDEAFPTIRIKPCKATPDFTIVCYGGMLLEAEKAALSLWEDDEIACEIIAPSVLSEINCSPIIESVHKSQRLILLEEGPTFAAYSSEIIAALAEHGTLPKVVKRFGHNGIIPCSRDAEKNLLLSADKIKAILLVLIELKITNN